MADLYLMPPRPDPAPDHRAGVQGIQLVGRNKGIAAYRSDGTVALMLAYDDRDITPADLVPFWSAMEQAIARLERDRPPAAVAATEHTPAAG
jgi:hypothetical protein